MTLRYGAVVRCLRSLRGDPSIPPLRPTEPAVRYRARPLRGIAPLADLYLPSRPTGASVVLVHGGGFVIGSRSMKPMRTLATRLSASGIAVCAVDYRMIFRGGRLDESVADVRDALAFWCARVPQLGLDPAAISMVGLSAGASIGLLAVAGAEAPPLAALVWCFGLYEVDHLRGVAGLLPRLLFRTADRAAWRDRSPRFATQAPAPTLLLHGSDDGLVPVEQAQRLAAHREVLGLPTRLVVYPGAPHGFFNVPSSAAEAGVRAIVDHVGRGSARNPLEVC
jgi:acetyl esterase/lipase